jgi:predicted nucleotidyltransferase
LTSPGLLHSSGVFNRIFHESWLTPLRGDTRREADRRVTYHVSMNEDVERTLRGVIAQAENDRDVLAVILFGSQARGDARPGSDVDVCIVLEAGAPSGLEASRKRLDYLAGRDLDVKIFQQLPLYIRSRVLKEARVLFARDEDRLYDLAFRTIRAFEDFCPHYQRYLDAVARD